EPPFDSYGKSLDVEIGAKVVGRLHYGRRRRHDQKPRTFPDPVNVPVTVHHDRSACQTLQSANEPVSVDQRRTDTLGERLRRPGIFDEMVVESDDPVGSRVFRSNDLDPPDLLSGDHSEGVREREMSIGVRVQQDDPEAVVPTWRKYHRKDLGPQLRQR